MLLDNCNLTRYYVNDDISFVYAECYFELVHSWAQILLDREFYEYFELWDRNPLRLFTRSKGRKNAVPRQ